MISKEEFARVQSILGKNARARTKLHAFPFRGIIRCGECGCFITAEEKHKETKSGLHRYIYYHCTKRKPNIHCSQLSIKKEELERQIKRELSKIAIGENFKNLSLRYLRKVHHQETKDRASIQSSLEKRYRDTQGQINSLTDMRVKKLIDDEEYLQHKNRLLLEREKLKERIDDTRHGADRWLELTERAFTFACYANYWFDHGTLEEKNTILRTIGSNFLLKDRKLNIELKNPWILLKKDLKKERWQIEGLEPSQIPDSTGLEPALSPIGFVLGAGRCSNLFRRYRRRGENPRLQRTSVIDEVVHEIPGAGRGSNLFGECRGRDRNSDLEYSILIRIHRRTNYLLFCWF